jgi:transcriptional regulator with XRE-family HTH domain
MPAKEFNSLGEFLKYERKKRNLTQPQFAELLETSCTNYKMLETDRYPCGIVSLQRFGEILKVSQRRLRSYDDKTREILRKKENDE